MCQWDERYAQAAQPDWYTRQDMLGMLMYTQCFGGTLNGVRAHLDYLEETGVLLLGEVVMEPSKVVPYFGSVAEPECHMLYNVTTMASTWHTVATQDEALAFCRMGMLHAFLLTLSGVPVLYSGDEIGQKNDYAYHEDPLRCEDSRYLHRGAFSWDDAQKRRDDKSWQGRIYRMLGELVKIRRTNRAFDAKADMWTFDTGSDHVLGLGRAYQGQKLLMLMNFSDEAQEIPLDTQGAWTDLRGGKIVHGYAQLPSWDFVWLTEA